MSNNGRTGANVGSFRNVVTIDRPLDDVFNFLSDFRNVPKWNYAITETYQLSAGPVTVGTVFVQRRHLPKPGEERFTVTEYLAPRRLAVQGKFGPFPARLSYELEPDDEGTVLTNSVELEYRGHLWLIGRIATSRVRKAVAANLTVLKQLLEERT